jgi:asparagine synthase (glutamine-hydrolysing)
LRPDWQTIAQFFLENELDAGPHTLYAGVERVPAGCYFHGDASAAPVFHRYWSVLEAAAEIAPPRDPVREFRELFDDAVRLRTRSDVPVGVLLSGGLDSTSIAATMAAQADGKDPPQRLSALCYLDPAYDETAFINATLEQTGASLYRLDPNPDELWDALRRHLWYQDEPVHSFTSVVAFQLMQLARERGLKVMLNGQGADEVLAGYLPFFVDHWADLARAGRIGDVLAETRSFAQVHEQALGTQYRRVAHRLFNQAKQSLPGHKLIAARWKKASLLRNPLLSDDLKSHWAPCDAPPTTTLTESLKDSVERSALPLYLRVEDRNAMAHGVEVRVPFLDHRLVAYGFRLGSEWKLSGGDTKVILRQAMQGRIPEAIRRSPKKLGFPTSANNWLRTVFYERCTELLLSRESRQSGVWNVDALEKTLMRRGDGVERAGRWLFNAAQFAMWYTMSRFATLLLCVYDAVPEISGV